MQKCECICVKYRCVCVCVCVRVHEGAWGHVRTSVCVSFFAEEVAFLTKYKGFFVQICARIVLCACVCVRMTVCMDERERELVKVKEGVVNERARETGRTAGEDG